MNVISRMTDRIAESYSGGARLGRGDAFDLYRDASLLELARLADSMRQRKHPNRVVTYIVSRNINYTNVCWVRCRFCAFYRPPGSEEGYVLPKEEILRKVRETVDAGGIEILIQGGLNPKLRLESFEDPHPRTLHDGDHLHRTSGATLRQGDSRQAS
jgi:cyclic dehypoxanthinyl futalosine synthase